MKKVKHIFTVFLSSFIPQDHFYPKLLHIRLQYSFKYYVAIISIYTCILTGIVVYQYSPQKIEGYKTSLFQTLASFPENIEVKITKGILESNQTKPLFLWMCDNDQPLFMFMVHSRGMLNSLNTPLPLIFLGSDTMRMSYKGDEIVGKYDKSLDVSITRDSLLAFIPKIDAYYPAFLFGFYFFLLLIVPLAFVGFSTFFILLSAGIVFLLLKTFIPHIHLKKCIQAGLHGTHIPLLITIMLYSLFPSASNVFIISVALIFIFTLVSSYEMYSKEVPRR